MTKEDFLKKYSQISVEIAIINRIIEEAIIHGGDPGGAYLTNEFALIESMERFIAWKGYCEKVLVVNNPDGFLQFAMVPETKLKKEIKREKQ